jgi:hypothetical protein
MDCKIETDSCTPSGGDVSLQKSDPFANTLVWGAIYPVQKSATGSTKSGGVCDVLMAKNPCNDLLVINMVGDTRKGKLCQCETRTGSGRKATLEVQS